jgi:hypothetical protein
MSCRQLHHVACSCTPGLNKEDCSSGIPNLKQWEVIPAIKGHARPHSRGVCLQLSCPARNVTGPGQVCRKASADALCENNALCTSASPYCPTNPVKKSNHVSPACSQRQCMSDQMPLQHSFST